jgi:uncharacterized protein (TIRG00374 family)
LVLIVKYQDKSVSVIIKIASALYRIFKKDLSEEKLTRELQKLFNAWNRLAHGGWKKPVIGSFLNVGLDVLTVFFLFWATGTYPSALAVITVMAAKPFRAHGFHDPGGVGLIESTMVALYNSLGIDNSVTTVVMLTYRFLFFLASFHSGIFLSAIFQPLNRQSLQRTSRGINHFSRV